MSSRTSRPEWPNGIADDDGGDRRRLADERRVCPNCKRMTDREPGEHCRACGKLMGYPDVEDKPET